MTPSEERSTRRSVCALDCPDACSLLVRVEGGRATALRGDPAHPVTQGFLCGKVARYLEREYSPDRLLHPQRRTGAKGEGCFERITWDEALDEIASRLAETSRLYGSESILPYSYAGTMGLLNGSGMDRRFFHRLGASRLERTICSSAGTAALNRTLGFRYGLEPERFRESRLIIAWGINVLGTNVHLWPFIVEARRRGARFYVIDPVRNRTAAAADRHYAIHPGSDQALALGLMHVLIGEGLLDSDYVERHVADFDRIERAAARYTPERVEDWTGIAAADVVALAREYASVQPAAIRLGYGVQRSERGGAAVEAISLLPALTGAWRRPGGGLLLTSSGAFHLNHAALERPELQMHSVLGREARQVNMVRLGEALTELDGPPVKALVVYNSNPAAVAPDQNRVVDGLSREDLFVVVLEQFRTDTADFADILLPATTFLEHTDLYYSYGHYHLQFARPALPAPGEAKSNFEVFRLLAARMGFTEPGLRATEDEVLRDALASGHPFLHGITLDQLENERSVRLRISEEGSPFLPFAEGGFGTESGRCEATDRSLSYVPPVESRRGDAGLLERYPLEFVSPKSDEGLNSTFGNRTEVRDRCAELEMHAADAAARGIGDGDLVVLHNDRGSCTLRARIAGTVAPGVVSARSVGWGRPNVNAVTSPRLTDIGRAAVFYSCLVEVVRKPA